MTKRINEVQWAIGQTEDRTARVLDAKEEVIAYAAHIEALWAAGGVPEMNYQSYRRMVLKVLKALDADHEELKRIRAMLDHEHAQADVRRKRKQE